MNGILAPRRTISGIKVTEFDAGQAGQGIRVAWMDESGAELSATRFGLTADRLANDLHASTLIGETDRQCFLIGFIRGLADSGGLDG